MWFRVHLNKGEALIINVSPLFLFLSRPHCGRKRRIFTHSPHTRTQSLMPNGARAAARQRVPPMMRTATPIWPATPIWTATPMRPAPRLRKRGAGPTAYSCTGSCQCTRISGRASIGISPDEAVSSSTGTPASNASGSPIFPPPPAAMPPGGRRQ